MVDTSYLPAGKLLYINRTIKTTKFRPEGPPIYSATGSVRRAPALTTAWISKPSFASSGNTQRRGWNATSEYVDVGISGSKERWPELDQLWSVARLSMTVFHWTVI